jgi:hypothetical protein
MLCRDMTNFVMPLDRVSVLEDDNIAMTAISLHCTELFPLSLFNLNSFLGAIEVIQDDGSAVEKELVGTYVHTYSSRSTVTIMM